MQDSCSQKISGCGVNANLPAICQSALDPSGLAATDIYAQFTASGGIVKGSHNENISNCLNTAFSLNGQWVYA